MNREDFVTLYKPEHDTYGIAQEVFENYLDEIIASAVQSERKTILSVADTLEFKPSKWSDLLTFIRIRNERAI